MAVSFGKLKPVGMGLTDKITFGKLKDCRVCDVIEDHHRYLLWAEKEGYIKFQPIVSETIAEAVEHANWKEEQEPKDPKLQDTYERFTNQFDDDYNDDIPF